MEDAEWKERMLNHHVRHTELLEAILEQTKKQTEILKGFRSTKPPTTEEMLEQGKKIIQSIMPIRVEDPITPPVRTQTGGRGTG